MKKFKVKVVTVLMVVLSVFMLSGCTGNNGNASNDSDSKASGDTKYTYEGTLKLTGLDEEFEVAYNDIYAMETVEEHMTNLTSSGELQEVDVTGVKLDDVLATKSISQKDFDTIRLIAGDGYSIDVPKDIISEKDIVLAFEFDGEPLDDKVQPLRASINDVRSMYWTSNLVEINFVKGESSGGDEVADGIQKIIFLETAAKGLEEHDYTYYESEDKAVKVDDLFKQYIPTASSDVEFVAVDGFEKSEKIDVLLEGYIKTTGESIPLFTAPDLPKGMQVKDILSLTCDDTSFISAANSLKAFTARDARKKTGVALDEVVEAGKLKGSSYIITAADGYSTEVASEDLLKGIIYEEEGVYSVKFTDDMPKSTNVKDVISVEVGTGSEETVSEDNSGEKEEAKSWEITFEGLSDGSFTLGSGKAEKKLTITSIEATKTSKSGEESVQAWDGYKVLDALEFLQVEDFEAIEVVANDGYSAEFTKEEVDDTMLLGVTVDGENLSEDTNLVQVVSKNLPSNKWVKGVEKIIVK